MMGGGREIVHVPLNGKGRVTDPRLILTTNPVSRQCFSKTMNAKIFKSTTCTSCTSIPIYIISSSYLLKIKLTIVCHFETV